MKIINHSNHFFQGKKFQTQIEKSELTEITSFSSALHLNLVISPECPV